MDNARPTSILKKKPKYLPQKVEEPKPIFSLAGSYLFKEEKEEDWLPVAPKSIKSKKEIEKEKIANFFA